jgi:hypothetical protein
VIGGVTVKACSTPDCLRGFSPNLIIFDEASFTYRFGDAYEIVNNSLKPYGKIFIGSTPNGIDFFHKIWSDAETDKNNFKSINFHWSDFPGRDIEWYENMKKVLNYNEQKISQELDAQFVVHKDNKQKTISLRITEDLYSKIGSKLVETDKNFSEYVRELIVKDLRNG